jgi:hypothetical protein
MVYRKVWIFQANPERYNVLNALADESLKEDAWLVSRYKDQIRSGDIGLIWVSGKESGIYAVVDVTSNVQLLADSPESTQYWRNPSDRNQILDRVRIHRVLNRERILISEEELRAIPKFNIENIFPVRQGTNFRVEGKERKIILDLLNRRFGYVP